MKSYLDFAENDYLFFMDAYEHCTTFGPLASIAQNICEKYLKHLIDTFVQPEDEIEALQKENILKVHSLVKLIRFLKNEMKIKIPKDVEASMRIIDGYYFSTRYPGDDAFFADAEDIENSADAVKLTRQFVYDTIKQLNSNNPAKSSI